VPSDKKKYALPVMFTRIYGNNSKKGVSSALFDPRLNENRLKINKYKELRRGDYLIIVK